MHRLKLLVVLNRLIVVRHHHTSCVNYYRRSTYSPDSEYRQTTRPSRPEQILSDIARDENISEDEAANLLSVEYPTLDTVKSLMSASRDEADKHEKLKRQAINRKLYNKPKPVNNLLSWSAKEQIRHLHRLDPEYWTVHRLAESFPCGAKHIRNVIQNRQIMYSQEDIDKHDEKVRELWGQIASGEHTSLLPATVEMLSRKPDCIAHSDGIKSLPLPTPRNSVAERAPLTKGVFSRIIQDYIEMTSTQKQQKAEHRGSDGDVSDETQLVASRGAGGDDRFVMTRESADVARRERASVRPDPTGRSLNIGYLQPPPRHRGPVRAVTFEEYRRRNPGVVLSGGEGGVASSGTTHNIRDSRHAEMEYQSWRAGGGQQHAAGCEGTQIRASTADGTQFRHASDSRSLRVKVSGGGGLVSGKDKEIRRGSYFGECQEQAREFLKQRERAGRGPTRDGVRQRQQQHGGSAFRVPNFKHVVS